MFNDEDFPPLTLLQRKVQSFMMLTMLCIIMPILCGALVWQTITIMEKDIEIQNYKIQLKSTDDRIMSVE